MKKTGFTLLELIIYIGISTIVIMATFSFFFMLVGDKIKQERITHVDNMGQFILKKISYHTKRAAAIDLTTAYHASPGKLVLNYIANPQIIFDTYQKQIMIGGAPVTITKLRMKTGLNPADDLTSDEVTVVNYAIENVSNGGSIAAQINLTLQSVNSGNIKPYEVNYQWSETIALRTR